jgi:hypothetical protein
LFIPKRKRSEAELVKSLLVRRLVVRSSMMVVAKDKEMATMPVAKDMRMELDIPSMAMA